jgi:hypothetical protein
MFLQLMAYLQILGGVWVVWHAAGIARRTRRVRSWPTVHGTITRSVVGSNAGARTAHGAQIEYSYIVHERGYRGKAIRPGEPVSSSTSDAQECCMKYPEGASVSVIYNPSNPEVAYLELPQQRARFWAIMGTLLIILGVESLIRQAL